MLKARVTGNIGQEATIKETNGTKYITFSVADNKKWIDKNGKKVESTNWVTVFGRFEHMEKSMKFMLPGTRILVEGNLSVNVYTNKKNEKVAGITINAEFFEIQKFVESKVSWVDEMKSMYEGKKFKNMSDVFAFLDTKAAEDVELKKVVEQAKAKKDTLKKFADLVEFLVVGLRAVKTETGEKVDPETGEVIEQVEDFVEETGDDMPW